MSATTYPKHQNFPYIRPYSGHFSQAITPTFKSGVDVSIVFTLCSIRLVSKCFGYFM